jgi:hypothetical protein
VVVRLAGRAAVSFGRRLGILRDGGSCRRVSAQLVLCRVVSTPAIVQGYGAWSRDGGVGGGAGGLPLLGVCSQETSTPCTWSMVAFAFAFSPGGVQCGGRSAMAAVGVKSSAQAISKASASGAHDRGPLGE